MGIIGAIVGAIVGHIIAAVFTKGPKYPGDTSYEGGIGFWAYLVIVAIGAVIGALAFPF